MRHAIKKGGNNSILVINPKDIDTATPLKSTMDKRGEGHASVRFEGLHNNSHSKTFYSLKKEASQHSDSQVKIVESSRNHKDS